MMENHIINIEKLKPFGSVETISEQAKSLVLQQQSIWQLAKKNYEGLKKIKTSIFEFENFKVVTQFNPERIRSSAAKTDKHSIAKRPCFLCIENLAPEQKGFLINKKYLLLANPYPIFPYHLTISSLNHTPQLIQNRIEDLLEISKRLTDFTVFYNGPRCGASAPDHFHFQAAVSGYIPVENEINLNSEVILNSEKIKISASKNYLRNFIAFESDNKEEVIKYFKILYKTLKKQKTEPEPMLNLLCKFIENKWQLIVFPRSNMPQSHFFKIGNDQIIIGPAAIELGGLLILPRKEDFKEITKKVIQEIYKKITLNETDFSRLTEIFEG